MSEIVDFLRARVDEDEARALAASQRGAGTEFEHWQWETEETDTPVKPGEEGEALQHQSISLRSEEHYNTSLFTLPSFIIAGVQEGHPAGLEHVATWDPARVLAECTAKRAIIDLHAGWPVLAERETRIEEAGDMGPGPQSMVLRMSREIAWMTETEYVKRFGVEPPTAPMIRSLAAVYSDHPDYQEDWRVG